jgi:acetoacetyl-CoA synthase
MLWQASETRAQNSQMKRFTDYIRARHGLESDDYAGLHKFSVEEPGKFWTEIFNYFDVIYQGDTTLAVTELGFDTYGWFPQVKLNFAENLLAHGSEDTIAVKSLLENGSSQEYSFANLRRLVAGFQQQLGTSIGPDDVLACYMPNIAETVIAMLATTASGGVFTSTSADFGIDGVVDRFGQARPRVLVACAGYEYNGRYFDCVPKIASIAANLDSIERVIIVDRYGTKPDISSIANVELWQPEKFIGEGVQVNYVQRPFAAPLYIMYSSGTTGKPKCIVHSTGGVLLQHIKELGLHSDHNQHKNIFFFTTCGWMMWNWLVSSLFFGGTTTLYEGSPAFPSFEKFIGVINREKITIFGTSPKYLKSLEDSKIDLSIVNFSSLETILCTGSPLLPEQYDFVYNRIKRDILLASISGGTDIIGCFFLGNPMMPVYRGELQCAGLGMDVACLGASGEAVIEQTGELVCRKSFPSRPIYFLNDPGNKKLHNAYFNTYKGIWYHGDFIKITRRGGAIFLGRSDATLNPGGVRIGTSEIYRQTENLDYIEDTVCVGKRVAGDVEVVLFVKMKVGEVLSETRVAEIKQRIKVNTTSRHVPKEVLAVTDIPYTRSGKKIELAVSRMINGQAITNREAITNPDCLEEYGRFFQSEVA